MKTGSPIVLGFLLLICGGAARAADGDFLRVSLSQVPQDLLLDLERRVVWLGDACERSLPIDRLDRRGASLHVEVSEKTESDVRAGLPAGEFRIALELEGGRGKARIATTLGPQPLEVPARASRLASPPCR